MERGIKSLEGPLFFATFALLLLGGAYAMWPSDFFGTAFSAMTGGALLRAAASIVLAIIGIEFLGALAIVLLSDS
jgi:hypothetical protein